MTTEITVALAADIRREFEAAEGAWRTAVQHAIRCGELLTEAKGHVGHGGWGAWLDENFPASRRTAQGYMRLASEKENAQRFAHLGIGGALKQLAAPKQPSGHLARAADYIADAEGQFEQAIGELDHYMHAHHMIRSDEELEEVRRTFAEVGCTALWETTSEGKHILVGYASAPEDDEWPVGDVLTYHPGWANYCRAVLGADGVRFATRDLMPEPAGEREFGTGEEQDRATTRKDSGKDGAQRTAK